MTFAIMAPMAQPYLFRHSGITEQIIRFLSLLDKFLYFATMSTVQRRPKMYGTQQITKTPWTISRLNGLASGQEIVYYRGDFDSDIANAARDLPVAIGRHP